MCNYTEGGLFTVWGRSEHGPLYLLSLMKDQAEAQKASRGIEGDVSLACVLGCVRFFAILRTVAHQAPLHWWVDSEPQEKHLADQKTSNATTWGQHTPDQWKFFYFTLRIRRAWRGCQPLGPRAFQAFRSLWRIHIQWGSAIRPFRKMLKLYIFLNCSVFLMSTLIFFILIFLQNIV